VASSYRSSNVFLGVIVSALVASAALFAVATVLSDDGGSETRPLLVLGDSLCVRARDDGADMTAMLRSAGWEPEYACGNGVPIDSGIEYVATRSEVPHDVVVALGTNGGPDEGDFDVKLATLRDDLVERGASHIVWVDFATSLGGYEGKNQTLHELVEAEGDTLTSWAARSNGALQYFQPDAVHHTLEGSTVWVADIVEALGEPDDS